MLKGAQKKMIVVKTGDSALFEEAYFVMRRETVAGRMDLLAEANKIIDGCGEKKRDVIRRKYGMIAIAVFSFAAGGGCGVGIAMLALLL